MVSWWPLRLFLFFLQRSFSERIDPIDKRVICRSGHCSTTACITGSTGSTSSWLNFVCQLLPNVITFTICLKWKWYNFWFGTLPSNKQPSWKLPKQKKRYFHAHRNFYNGPPIFRQNIFKVDFEPFLFNMHRSQNSLKKIHSKITFKITVKHHMQHYNKN